MSEDETNPASENEKVPSPQDKLREKLGNQIPSSDGVKKAMEGSSSEEGESFRDKSIQEQTEEVKKKFDQLQKVAKVAQTAITSIVNPVTGIILLVVLALVIFLLNAFSLNQVVGRNDNACLNQEDCSVVKISAPENGYCPMGSGADSWPNNAQPGSREAIQATYDVLLAAGFSPPDAFEMTVVAGGESTWNPRAINGSYAGLWQIGKDHLPLGPIRREDDRFDPVKAAAGAKILFDGAKSATGNGFQPWQAHPSSSLLGPEYVSSETKNAIIAKYRSNKALVQKALGAAPASGEGSLTTSSSPCIAGGGATCGPDCDVMIQRARAALQRCPSLSWGYSSYSGYCLGIVARIYQNGGSAGFSCPNERFGRYLQAGGTLITSAAQAASVPVGAVILVTSGSNYCSSGNYGHAMISTGGGKVITTYWTGAEGRCLAEVTGWRGAAYGPGTRYLWIPPSKIWGNA